MKIMRLLCVLASLLAINSLSGASAYGQLLNGNFADGLGNWTILNSTFPFPSAASGKGPSIVTGPPLGLVVGGGFVNVQNGVAVLSTAPRRRRRVRADGHGVVPDVSLAPIKTLPGTFGGGVGCGCLQLTTYGNIKPSAILQFNAQFLTDAAPGVPTSYGRVQVDGVPLLVVQSGDPNTTGPGAFGFGRSSPVISVTQNISSLFGTTVNLTGFVARTTAAAANSGLALSDVQVTEKYAVQDSCAIGQAWCCGLSTAQAQGQILLNTGWNANRDVDGRLFRMRAGMRQDELSGGGNGGGSSPSEASSAGAAASAPGGYGKDSKETKEVLPPEEHWSFFTTGNYGYRDLDNSFTGNLFTATVGGEYHCSPCFALGLAATRVESDNSLGGCGNTNLEGWNYCGYLTYDCNNFYLDGLCSLGTYNNNIQRNAGSCGACNGMGGQGSTATAQPNSMTNGLQLNTGYNFTIGSVITGPIGSLNWMHGNVDGYTEQQAGLDDLTVPGQRVDSLKHELGWQFSLPIPTGFGTVTPQLRASWFHEYLNNSEDLTVGLQTSPYYLVNGSNVSRFGSFSATGATKPPGADYIGMGAGVAVGIGARAALVVDWETQFAQARSTAQVVSLTGQVRF